MNEALYGIIIGNIIVCDWMAMVLFDPGSTYSYMSIKFSLGLDLVSDMLDSYVYISTLVRDFVVVTQLYHACSMMFMVLKTQVPLVSLGMFYIGIIFSFTCMSPYYVVQNCNTKMITLDILGWISQNSKVFISKAQFK